MVVAGALLIWVWGGEPKFIGDWYMELVPREIERYLSEDEVFERQYNLRDFTVYVLNKRLLIKQGRLVRDINYSHIKNIKYEQERRFIVLFGGIALIILAGGVTWFFDFGWLDPPGLGLVSMGIILSIMGLVPRERVDLEITGQSVPLKLRAVDKIELDSLVRLITERKP
jgi:hypothetical protein